MTLENLLALWPIVMAVGAIWLRIGAIRAGRDLELRVALETGALVLAISAGVGFGLLFGARVMW